MSTLYRPRIYRLSSGALVIGIGGMIASGWYGWSPLFHLIAGTPMIVTDGKAMVPHPASTMEMQSSLAVAAIFFAACLYGALAWINAIVVADETGIVARNAFGITSFRATWPEIDRVDLIAPGPRGGNVGTYVFHAGPRRLKMYGYPDVDELIGLVKDRAPHVSFS